MVTATVNQGIVNLESSLQITEGELTAIKKNPQKVKAFLAGAHTCHTIAMTEEGLIISKMGEQVQGSFDPITEANFLHDCHRDFCKRLRMWIETGMEERIEKPAEEPVEEPKDEQKQPDNAETEDKDAMSKILEQVRAIVGDVPFSILLLDGERKETVIAGTVPLPAATTIMINQMFNDDDE